MERVSQLCLRGSDTRNIPATARQGPESTQVCFGTQPRWIAMLKRTPLSVLNICVKFLKPRLFEAGASFSFVGVSFRGCKPGWRWGAHAQHRCEVFSVS